MKRKDNNIVICDMEGSVKSLKLEVTDEIYIFGEINLNSKLLNFASQKEIIIHFFNYYGFYSGSFYPRETKVSGYLMVEQVALYMDHLKRLSLAKEILRTASYNIYRNLRYYNSRGVDLEFEMKDIHFLTKKLESGESINELMGLEGNIHRKYYLSWNKIVHQEIDFDKRIKRPPDNMINTIISFVNSLIYTTVLSEIYNTQLNPTISYLHEPGTKRFSLSLDIAEIFKPLIGDRLIFSLLNKNQITNKHFEKASNYLYITDSGRKIILKEYDKRLERTIRSKELRRDVSYRYLIRLECYKLIKHIIGEKDYDGFKMNW